MPVVPIHDDEIRATAGQVRRLVAAQCPQWAGLRVTPLPGEVEGKMLFDLAQLRRA